MLGAGLADSCRFPEAMLAFGKAGVGRACRQNNSHVRKLESSNSCGRSVFPNFHTCKIPKLSTRKPSGKTFHGQKCCSPIATWVLWGSRHRSAASTAATKLRLFEISPPKAYDVHQQLGPKSAAYARLCFNMALAKQAQLEFGIEIYNDTTGGQHNTAHCVV